MFCKVLWLPLRNTVTKITAIEANQRVTAVYKLLVGAQDKDTIVRYASEKWGIGRRQAENYISKANKLFDEEAIEERQHALGKVLRRAEGIYRDAAKDGDRVIQLRSLDMIINLFGLAAPTKNINVNVDANSLSDAELDKQFTELLDTARSNQLSSAISSEEVEDADFREVEEGEDDPTETEMEE